MRCLFHFNKKNGGDVNTRYPIRLKTVTGLIQIHSNLVHVTSPQHLFQVLPTPNPVLMYANMEMAG